MVDDEPRADFGDDEVAALKEVADAIAQHLENVRVVQYHGRAESLVIGLTNFVKGHAKFDPIEASSSGRLDSSRNMRSYQDQKSSDGGCDVKESLVASLVGESQSNHRESNKSYLTTHSDEPSPLFSSIQGSETTGSSSLDFETSEQPASLKPSVEALPDNVSGAQDSTNSDGSLDKFSRLSLMDSVPISERIATIFSRASVLLRDTMDLDGVAFFDAYRNDTSLSVSLIR